MEVIKQFSASLDICTPQASAPVFQVMQGDNSRYLKLAITDCGKAYSIPVGTEISVCYANAVTSGVYTTVTKDGVEVRACSVSGNVVTVAVSEAVTEHPGLGEIALRFTLPDGRKIGALPSIRYQCFYIPCEECESPVYNFERVHDKPEWFAMDTIDNFESCGRYLPY